MNVIRRSYPALLVLVCLSMLLLLSVYALAMLPPIAPTTAPGGAQIPDLVLKLTPNASPHHASPIQIFNASTHH